ncbi:MAG: glycosyltransferase family 2 protein [Bryobacterales bacterium]
MGFRTLVGIPAYNAERSISEVLERVKRQPVDAIVVVDDGSRDQTRRLLQSLSDIHYILHPENRGYGAAQKTIFEYFRNWKRSDDDVLVFVHADGEMRPEEIPDVVAPLLEGPDLDMVFGSRVLTQKRKGPKPAYHVNRPSWKTTLDAVATTAQNLVYKADLTTYFGGFRAIRGSSLDKIDYQLCHDRHFFDQELLIRCVTGDVRVREVPISNVENGSVSHYSMFQVASQILRFASHYAFRGVLPCPQGRDEMGLSQVES